MKKILYLITFSFLFSCNTDTRNLPIYDQKFLLKFKDGTTDTVKVKGILHEVIYITDLNQKEFSAEIRPYKSPHPIWKGRNVNVTQLGVTVIDITIKH